MNGALPLPEAYQSFGARATINLASKLMQSLLPVGNGAFRLDVPAALLVEQEQLAVPPDVQKKLTMCEDLITTKMETLRWRRPTFVSLLHLITTGNILEHMLSDGTIKQYRLDQFVAVRDWSGKVIEVITAEDMLAVSLPAPLAHAKGGKDDHQTVTVYTGWKLLDDKSYEVVQEVDNNPGIARHTVVGRMPVNALVWDLAPGEHYGRGHVEEHYADLRSLEHHTQHLVEGGALASRHLVFVKPNAAGGNLRKRITEARNGAVIAGNPEDVAAFQFNNSSALQSIQMEIERLTRSLSAVFLLTSELRRDAERVTAFELRQLAQEIETALGGTYTLLSYDMQAWRIERLMAQMIRHAELPPLGDGLVNVSITAGIEALGRDETVNRVNAALALIQQAGASHKDAGAYVKFDAILTPGLNALGFAAAVRTDAEVQLMRQQEQKAQMAQQIAASAAGPLAQAAAQGQQPIPQ